MPYLDKEEKFYDYGTGRVSGKDVIDITKTGTSFYDDFLTNKGREYLKNKHNLKGEIQYMTPNEYFSACGKYGFPRGDISPETLKHQRANDVNTIEHLKEVILKYKKKFPLPYINIADRGQEGLHRFYVIGELFGWDSHKYPVLIITHADEEEAKKRELAKRANEISSNIRYAIKDTLRYYFESFDEFKEQLQWSLDEHFRFDDSIEKPVEFSIVEDPDDPNYYIVKVDIGDADFEKASIHYVEPKETEEPDDLDLDLDDIDIDDFIVRYFGDDWRETHPHLKDVFGIKESYEHDLIIKTKRRDNENDISPFGHQVDFYKNNEKVGTCSVCGIKDNDAFIYDLQVFPEHRGKGYANDIMQYMIDKYDALHLYVDKDNYKAINLYKKFGWNIVGEAPEQEGQKPGWEMGRFETDFKPNLNESADELTTVGLGIKLRKDIEKGWSKETCHPSYQSKWSLEYPSTGQCAITAMWLNEKMGWDIYETIVNRSRHFFNKDSNGFIYDLTADQFQDSDIEYENCRKREFKDLYRSCKERYELFKHNLTSVNESIERLDIKQIDKYILDSWGSDRPGEGCIFIHPNGKFINIYPKLDDHEDLCYWLEEQGFDETPGDAEWFVDTFNYVRCRNSRLLCFVELPITNITRDQLYSLQEWFEEKVNTDYIDIELPDGTWNNYDLDEYFPEDLIKIIKRYYASGKLYEYKKLN